eukprot:Gb_12834 [translate_table: standard]
MASEILTEAVESIHGSNYTLSDLKSLMVVFLATWILFKIQQGMRCGSKMKLKLPPGPRPLPIIGNLLMMGKLPYRTLRDLSEKYGPIMLIRLGSVPTVVASSPETAKEFLKTHDLVFASRPETSAGKYMCYNSTDVVFAPYGPYWRQMRRICMSELLSPKRLEALRFIREEEISHMIQLLAKNSVNGSIPVNVSKALTSLTADMICRMAFGRKYPDEDLDSRGFKTMIQEVFHLNGLANIGDLIPYLEWMDLQGIRRRQRSVHKTFNAFFDKIIQEHRLDQTRPVKDLVDVLLEISQDDSMDIKITQDNIKSVIFDMLVAGTDTSAGTIDWAMCEVLKKPSVMKKLQHELDTVIGMERRVEESDLPRLEYLEAVVKETLRLHPPAPLMVPHEATEACTVGGYDIPYKSRILVNLWAIGRDPMHWKEAEKFKPERFVGSSMDVRGQHNFEFIPFGSGRRSCPGLSMAMIVVPFTLARLLHCFDWRLPDGITSQDLDMTEEFGLTAPRADNLLAIPTPRFKELNFP